MKGRAKCREEGKVIDSTPLWQVICFRSPPPCLLPPFSPNLQGRQFPMFNGEGRRVSEMKKRRGPAGLPLAGAEPTESEETGVRGRAPQRARSFGRS